MTETEPQKKKTGKGGLIALAVIVGILAVSNIYVYASLQNQITTVTNEKTALQNQITTVTNENNALLSQVTSLQTTYNNYIANHHYTDSEYNLLNDIVALRKSQMLDVGKTVNLVADGKTTLSYSTSYAGYIEVDFTASGPVYFWVGSSLTNTYYSRYPSTSPDTATSGSFKIPVLPGTTWLYIYHPALLIGVTITFTVTYQTV